MAMKCRVPGERSSVRLSFRCTPSEREALDEVARENGTTRMRVIRDGVNAYVADYRESGAEILNVRSPRDARREPQSRESGSVSRATTPQSPQSRQRAASRRGRGRQRLAREGGI
jgi:hypothetical protein